MQSAWRVTYSRNRGEPEGEWPLFPHALAARSSPGTDGEPEPPALPPRTCCALQRGWGCGLSAQSSAAPCRGHCRGPAQTWPLYWEEARRIRDCWGGVGLG